MQEMGGVNFKKKQKKCPKVLSDTLFYLIAVKTYAFSSS